MSILIPSLKKVTPVFQRGDDFWMEVYPDRIGAAAYTEFIQGRNDG
ncbi:MAG: hypothetical protein R6U13_12270 [Desulfatiglandaceae bacterium]